MEALSTNTNLAKLPKRILNPTDYRARFLELNNYVHHSKIYTDGSKTDSRAGYAIRIITDEAKITQNLPTSSSITACALKQQSPRCHLHQLHKRYKIPNENVWPGKPTNNHHTTIPRLT